MVYNFRGVLQSLLRLPAPCQLCGASSDRTPGLCRDCRDELPWLQDACRQCARPLAGPAPDTLCGRCQSQPPAFDLTTALFHYRPPVDHLVKRFKFAEELAVGELLAAMLAARLAARTARLPRLLLPVPLHPARLHGRGFNQATEIARCIGSRLGIGVDSRACRRKRDTEAQSLLSPNARRINLRNAFAVRRPPAAAHIAIIDDVMTTGHTANELARVLREAGVDHIEVWVLARAGGLSR